MRSNEVVGKEVFWLMSRALDEAGYSRSSNLIQESVMSKKALAFAVAAACLTVGTAHAQSHDYRYDQRAQHSDRSGYYNEGERQYRGERSEHRSDRWDGYRSERDDRYRSDRYGNRNDNGRNYGGYDDGQRGERYDRRDYRYRNNGYDNAYRAHLRRGERLSHHYGRQYVVSDWRGHRGLYAPHRGHQWVQVGSNYALVAIATGIIAHVLLN